MSEGGCAPARLKLLWRRKEKGPAFSARTLSEAHDYCCIAAWMSVTCRVLVALSRLPLAFTCLPSHCLALSWASIWYVPVSVFRTYLSPDFTTVPVKDSPS